jgi:hypothetical protein
MHSLTLSLYIKQTFQKARTMITRTHEWYFTPDLSLLHQHTRRKRSPCWGLWLSLSPSWRLAAGQRTSGALLPAGETITPLAPNNMLLLTYPQNITKWKYNWTLYGHLWTAFILQDLLCQKLTQQFLSLHPFRFSFMCKRTLHTCTIIIKCTR